MHCASPPSPIGPSCARTPPLRHACCVTRAAPPAARHFPHCRTNTARLRAVHPQVDGFDLKSAIRNSGAIAGMYQESLTTFGYLVAATLAFDLGVFAFKVRVRVRVRVRLGLGLG